MQKLPIEFKPIDKKDLPDLLEIKYKLIKDADHLVYVANMLHPAIGNVIKSMLAYSTWKFEDYELCYLDVKVRDLKKGGSGDWYNNYHYDWVRDYDHPNKHETHLIYSNIFGTHYKEDGVVKQCEPNRVYMYGRELHCSPIVTEDCRRVLIRLSFVDKQ
jgi:hypothetical protein